MMQCFDRRVEEPEAKFEEERTAKLAELARVEEPEAKFEEERTAKVAELARVEELEVKFAEMAGKNTNVRNNEQKLIFFIITCIKMHKQFFMIF